MTRASVRRRPGTLVVPGRRHVGVPDSSASGRAGVDLEFHKRFDQCRFDTAGRNVAEQLVDERVFVE